MLIQRENTGDRRPCKQRRSGKDRRKHIDPRYRNPAYPEFCDRRRGERRKPVYEDHRPLIKEHPDRKWITLVGIVAAVFLMSVSILTNAGVSTKLASKKIGNVSNAQLFPYILPRLF
ncbi:MAG: hypothetical protein JW883_10300 [Deltaproteobacteria bacterium]|nr:hypothetical protein [Deltaproteobacteria bacterium]